MAFDAGTVLARLKLDGKQFSAAIKKSVREIGTLRNAVKAVFGSLLVREVTRAAQALFQFARSSAQASDIAAAFERMARVKGLTSGLLIRRVREITTALSDRQILRAANMIELLGVGMENLPRLVEIARAAAIGLGQDVGFMLESLATGTARQSRLWLDNLGIIISVEEANRKYARTIGKTVSELTDFEQRAAFLNAVLDKGGDIIAKVDQRAESQTEKINSLGAAWRNLADAIGEATTKKTSFLAKGISRALEREAEAIRRGGLFGSLFADTGLPIPGTGGQFLRPSPQDNLPFAPRTPRGLRESVDFQRLLSRTRGLGVPAPFGPIRQRGSGFFPVLDFTQFETPGLMIGEIRQASLDASEAVSSLTSSFEALGEAIVSGANAGKAFGVAILSSMSNVASLIGDMFIKTGIGMLSLGSLNPFAAIAAGSALKLIAGLMRGGAATAAAPAPPGPASAVSSPLRGEDRLNPVNVVVQGDFLGDPVWIDRLVERIRVAQRNRGVEVVFA